MPSRINDHAPETALHEEIKQISAKMEVLLPYLDKLHDKIDDLHVKVDSLKQVPPPEHEPPKSQ